jgi:hypothetical protein
LLATRAVPYRQVSRPMRRGCLQEIVQRQVPWGRGILARGAAQCGWEPKTILYRRSKSGMAGLQFESRRYIVCDVEGVFGWKWLLEKSDGNRSLKWAEFPPVWVEVMVGRLPPARRVRGASCTGLFNCFLHALERVHGYGSTSTSQIT